MASTIGEAYLLMRGMSSEFARTGASGSAPPSIILTLWPAAAICSNVGCRTRRNILFQNSKRRSSIFSATGILPICLRFFNGAGYSHLLVGERCPRNADGDGIRSARFPETDGAGRVGHAEGNRLGSGRFRQAGESAVRAAQARSARSGGCGFAMLALRRVEQIEAWPRLFRPGAGPPPYRGFATSIGSIPSPNALLGLRVRSGGSMSIEERLANRGATTHVAKLVAHRLSQSGST